MIGQLLELDRWQFAHDELPREAVNLAELIAEVVADADFEAASQNRRVRAVGLEKCFVRGVPALLRSAVENVVRNAARHTAEETSVKVSLNCKIENGDAYAVVTVRDAGAGVPAEAIDHIFKPFYRVDEARDRESGGAGLGLAITERAIKLHHGHIVAANDADTGFVIQIILPIAANETFV